MAGIKKGGLYTANQINPQADDNTSIPVVTTSSPSYGASTTTTDVFDTLDNIRLNTLGGNTNSTFVAGIDKSQGYYDLNFKSLSVSGDLELTNYPDSILLSLKLPENSPSFIESGQNLSQTGVQFYKGISGSALTFKSLNVGSNLTLVQDDENVTLSLNFDPIFGDVQGASNLGFSTTEINNGTESRLGIFHSKDGTNLLFRRIVSANNILSISPNSANDQIVISFDENQLSIANISGNLSVNRVTGLHPVATSGNYLDLSNRPIIPYNLSDLHDVSGVPANGDVLKYVTNVGWQPSTLSSPNFYGIVRVGSTIMASNTPNATVEFSAGSELNVEAIPSGNRVSYNLKPTGVIAGSYSNVTLTVDTYGRITSIQQGASITPYVDPMTTTGDIVYRAASGTTRLPIGNEGQVLTTIAGVPRWQNTSSSGSVTSVGLLGKNGVKITGGPITDSGIIEVGLIPTGVAAGTYNLATIRVDEFGRVISASNNSGGSTVSILAGQGLDGGGDLSQTRTLSLKLTGVNAGTYTNPQITIDAYGRITNASNGSGGGGGGVTSVNGTGQNGITVTGGPITSTGSLTIGLSNSGVTSGTYGVVNFTVNAQGRITAIDNDNPAVLKNGLSTEDGEPIIDPTGGIFLSYYTTAQLQNKNHAVNTQNKDLGKMVLNQDDFFIYFATGEGATDYWTRQGNSTTNPNDRITPV